MFNAWSVTQGGFVLTQRRQSQLRSFRVRFLELHVPRKPTGLAAHGTYREL